MKEIFLMKLGEVVLKGANKRQFEGRLRQNVRRRMKPYGDFDVYIMQSTVYVEPMEETCDVDGAWEAAHSIFGVVSLCRCRPFEKNLDGVWTDKKADHCNYLKNNGLSQYRLPATNGMMTLKKALDDKFFDLLDKYAKKYGRNQALQYMLTDNNRHLIEVYGSDNTKTGFFSKYIQAFREMKSMRIREEISKYCEINWI